MEKRMISVLLALCLLLTMLPSAGLAQEARFGSAEELTSWLYYDCAYMLADRIEFSYTQSLDYLFADGFPWKMLYSSGMVDMDVDIDRTHRRVTISNIEYYPGFKAAQAWEIEMIDMLDEDERSMLAHAEDIVEEAQRSAQSPYQVLVNLHDALTRRIVYTRSNSGSGEWNYRDTAIGGLVYGECECDGYADAFYLLATLSGFSVRMISGYSDNGNGNGFVSHMWNLLWWEDGWYHVDVTMDDLDWNQNSAVTNYPYLLMGSATITSHQWEASHLVCQPQPYTNWNQYYYTCDGNGMTYGAYYQTLENVANYAAYLQQTYGRRMIHVMIDGDHTGKYDPIHRALEKAGLKGQWTVWAKKNGEYSYITIYLH